MKYIRTYESYRNSKNQEPVNEEFLFGLLGKLFGKIKERINKTKGGKEIDVVYQKWLKIINDQVAKLGITDLNILNAATDKSGEKPATKDEAKSKALNDILTKQKAKIEQIIAEAQKGANLEMEAILQKMGGAAKNPQLDMLIKSKIIQFKIDVLNAEVAAFNRVGDAAAASKVQKDADTESKKVENTLKDFDTAKAVTYKEGDEVIYLLKDKKKEDWDKLSDDEKKKPTEGKAKDLVGVHKLVKIEGDKYTIEDADGKPTIVKTGAEIIGLANPGEEGADTEYKVGDTVIYKREKFNEEEWKKLSDDEKKKSDEGKMKELQKEQIGIKKISKIEGDKISFEGADFTKEKGDILMKTEAGKAEGQEDLTKTLGEIKTKNPEAIGKVGDVAKLYQDPAANKDKIAEIEKLLGGEEGK